jgi:hypothetical protein
MTVAQSGTRPGGEASICKVPTRAPTLVPMVLVACAAVLLAPVQPVHAADDVCGEAKAAPQALYERVAKDSRVREMHRNELYVGLENGENGTLWTFTLPTHPAHPAAVCRRVMERRGVLDIPTIIVCEGAEAACAQLKTDFEALNQRVIEDLYKQQAKRLGK